VDDGVHDFVFHSDALSAEISADNKYHVAVANVVKCADVLHSVELGFVFFIEFAHAKFCTAHVVFRADHLHHFFVCGVGFVGECSGSHESYLVAFESGYLAFKIAGDLIPVGLLTVEHGIERSVV